MPIYEYYCEDCKYKFEEWNKVEDREVEECPKCKKEAKLIPSKGHFKLKGNWH